MLEEKHRMEKEKTLDIQAYLKRINYQGTLEPTLQTLQALQRAHMLTVPFENLSIDLTNITFYTKTRLLTGNSRWADYPE
jgi:arylamine N-acetyltransferase